VGFLEYVTTPDASFAPTTPELARLVERTKGLQPWRRVFHACNGLVLALGPGALGLERPVVVGWLAVVVVLLFAADLARLRAPQLNVLFFRTFPSFASPREATAIASSSWYALGILLAWALFPAPVAVPAILVMALADPVASVIGRRFGRRRLGKGTVEGSAAFFVMASVVLVLSTRQPAAAAVAGVVSLVEVLPWKLDDNLTIPLTAGSLLMLLSAMVS
jgi:dolichol kinase